MNEADSPSAAPPEADPRFDDGASAQTQQEQGAKKSSEQSRVNGLMSSLGRKESERAQAVAERDAVIAEMHSLREQMNVAADAATPPTAKNDDDEDEERLTPQARPQREFLGPGIGYTGWVDPNNPSRSAGTPASDPNDERALRSQLNSAFRGALTRDD